MGVDVVAPDGFEFLPAADLQGLFVHENELFDSPSDDSSHSTVTTEEDDAVFSGDSPPRDAPEEWPSLRQARSFYFVRHGRYPDPEIKAKIDLADKEIYKCNLAWMRITSAMKAKRAERAELFVQLEILRAEREGINAIFDEKKKEMEQEALRRQWSYDGSHLCSSDKELDDRIYSLQYRIQHESVSLEEEKQLIKEIKQLEEAQENVMANSTMSTKYQDSLGEDCLKLIRVNMDEIKKGRQVVAAEINLLCEKLKATKMEMDSLDMQLMGVIAKRDKAFETITTLRRQQDHGNATFFQSMAVLTKAKKLAANGNVKALEELANSEVDKFMSLWNSDKAFRDDYAKRVLPSLDSRQLSRDGRISDYEEELPVASEASAESGTSHEGRAGYKREREDSESSSSQDSSLVKCKLKKETGKNMEDFNRSTSEESYCIDFDILSCEKAQNEEEIDDKKLKEKRREEEAAKAQQAMERKRRLQEKAAAKASIRAQKEAEKKLKEREKKAKKKAATSSSTSEREWTSETVTEASEPEKSESSSSSAKEKSVLPRHRVCRYRHRAKRNDALPKAILKRRRAAKYWFWTISSIAVALVLLMVTYFYVN